jgi:hypothetical protein
VAPAARDVAAKASVSSGPGYWLVTSAGQVYAFGGATNYGGMNGQHLTKAIVGIASSPDGKGYWLFGADGGVFAFGDASFYGSQGGTGTSTPVVAGASVQQAGTGATGPAGPIGPAGPTGPQGPVGQPDYAYIYNVAAQTVALEGPVLFDSNGPLTGFTHTAGSAAVTVVSSGTYLVDFSVSGTEPNQFSLFADGSALAGTTYGSGAGTQQNGGQVMVSLVAGDVLTLVNHSSAAAIGLASDIGGTQANVNASLVIEELG